VTEVVTEVVFTIVEPSPTGNPGHHLSSSATFRAGDRRPQSSVDFAFAQRKSGPDPEAT
jgi:hypothetical protein